jgi:hypothetical protein
MVNQQETPTCYERERIQMAICERTFRFHPVFAWPGVGSNLA